MWNICTKEGSPTILLDENTAVPEGYVVEAQTADPNYSVNPVVDYGRRVTLLAFRNRFTKTEKITIEMASLDNPASSMPARQMAAALRVDLKDSDSANFIDLDRADTRAGVQTLETYGILGVGRALQILDAPVQQVEIPTELV